MTVLSAAIGFALPNLLPRVYTHYAAVILVSGPWRASRVPFALPAGPLPPAPACRAVKGAGGGAVPCSRALPLPVGGPFPAVPVLWLQAPEGVPGHEERVRLVVVCRGAGCLWLDSRSMFVTGETPALCRAPRRAYACVVGGVPRSPPPPTPPAHHHHHPALPPHAALCAPWCLPFPPCPVSLACLSAPSDELHEIEEELGSKNAECVGAKLCVCGGGGLSAAGCLLPSAHLPGSHCVSCAPRAPCACVAPPDS
jgi:hypothetical protein